MNVSFVGLTDLGWSSARDVSALQRGDHDPRVNGFTIPNAELVLDGAVDPYSGSTQVKSIHSGSSRPSGAAPMTAPCSSGLDDGESAPGVGNGIAFEVRADLK